MNRICGVCEQEKQSIEGTFQQVCCTPSCVVIMFRMLMNQMASQVEE